MSAAPNTIIISVKLQPREDGGLRAFSDDIPGFVLSHSDSEALAADIKPALETMLSALFDVPVSVSEVESVRARIDRLVNAEQSAALASDVDAKFNTRFYAGFLGKA